MLFRSAPCGPVHPGTGVPAEVVRAALTGFAGTHEQRPPAYSAKHVDGERSYRLARRGEAVAPRAVPVTVHRIELVSYSPPEVVFRATVGAGTYLRAIARDLGDRLGTGAHLTALRRESIGDLSVEDAVSLDELTPAAVRPARAVLGHLPVRELDEAARVAVSHGRAVEAGDLAEGDVALVRGDELIAVARAVDGWLKPSVVLGTP